MRLRFDSPVTVGFDSNLVTFPAGDHFADKPTAGGYSGQIPSAGVVCILINSDGFPNCDDYEFIEKQVLEQLILSGEVRLRDLIAA